jgi:hypothetical protein
MRRCDVPSLNGVACPGHLVKFDDCLAEALHEWSLDSALGSAGDCGFEGHVALVQVAGSVPTRCDVDGREVEVPPGVYLVWTASSGAVTVTEVDSLAGGQEVIRVNLERWALWDAGCDPDDPAGHEECGDVCRKPEWADR